MSKAPDSSPKTLIVDTRAMVGLRSHGVLTVVGGVDTGRVMKVSTGKEVTLGRSESCTYRFDDASVSGTHARIVQVTSSFTFVDAGSTNGSFVNDARVTAPTPVRDGDRIQLGSGTFLRFSLVSEEEELAMQKMYEAALRDGLTGVFNRKHLEERLEAEIAYALRHSTELSLAILDVDHFKRVNDTHGHLAGDAVLKCTAQVLGRGIRGEDVLARYGGEEFVVIARGTAVGPALAVADRLREMISQTEILVGNVPIRVTVSGGVASLDCCDAQKDRATLLGLADARLYQAKQAGRNRVIGAS